MKAHIIQHVEFEGPGRIADILSRRGWTLSYSRMHGDARLPHPREVDFLVIMGGPMSVHDRDEHPWLTGETDFIRGLLLEGRAPVLGICLGAQLMAHALGAAVAKNPHREIGWYPVSRAPGAAEPWATLLPPSFPAFHWHGETFALPAGAQALASSAACANQAFLWGEKALGLQFHLESTAETVAALLDNASGDLRGGGDYVASPASMRSLCAEHGPVSAALLERMLDELLTKGGS